MSFEWHCPRPARTEREWQIILSRGWCTSYRPKGLLHTCRWAGYVCVTSMAPGGWRAHSHESNTRTSNPHILSIRTTRVCRTQARLKMRFPSDFRNSFCFQLFNFYCKNFVVHLYIFSARTGKWNLARARVVIKALRGGKPFNVPACLERRIRVSERQGAARHRTRLSMVSQIIPYNSDRLHVSNVEKFLPFHVLLRPHESYPSLTLLLAATSTSFIHMGLDTCMRVCHTFLLFFSSLLYTYFFYCVHLSLLTHKKKSHLKCDKNFEWWVLFSSLE